MLGISISTSASVLGIDALLVSSKDKKAGLISKSTLPKYDITLYLPDVVLANTASLIVPLESILTILAGEEKSTSSLKAILDGYANDLKELSG
ncbi:MAG: hypothetical protein ACK5XN_36705 [Bacteroidota bacterium]